MCDGWPFRLTAFPPPGGSRRPFPRFPWPMGFTLCALFDSLLDCVCDATTCPRENPQSEFSRPCDNLSCLFFTALWLQRSQSMLVQEIRPAKDIDLTCFKTLPIKATTCLQVDPCPWIGQRIQLQDSSNPDLRSLPKFPATINNETLFQLPHVPVGDRILFKHHCKNHSVIASWYTCGHFPDGSLRCIAWNARGLFGSVLSSQINRELKLKYLSRLLDNDDIICLQEAHGKDEFLQAIQVLAPRFRLFGTFFPDNENAGGSASFCIHEDLRMPL